MLKCRVIKHGVEQDEGALNFRKTERRVTRCRSERNVGRFSGSSACALDPAECAAVLVVPLSLAEEPRLQLCLS